MQASGSTSATPAASDVTSPIDQPTRYPYQPSLDGVRAVAVLAVVLFHTEVDGVGGGFLGVDVFLALSGFLITTLLLREFAETKRIRVGAFYGRRARRLLPALFLVVGAVAFFGRYAADAFQLDKLRGDALSSVLYFANWRFIDSGGGYFEELVSPSPLRHVWSLAIEEQWYFIWPLVVLAALALIGLPLARRRWAWIGLTAAGAVASAALMAALVDDADLNRVYYGTDTRAQALLIGTTLAVLMHARVASERVQRIVDVVGIFGLLGCVAMFGFVEAQDTWMYRGGFFLVAVFATMMIAGAVVPTRGVTRTLLSLPPLPALGRISYGVYLWHWPIIVYLDEQRTGLSGARLFVVRFVVTILVSIASYDLVERPIRERRWRTVGGIALAGTAAALVIVLTVTLIPTAPVKADVDATTISASSAKGMRVLVAGDSVGTNLNYWYRDGQLGRTATVANAAVLGCGIPLPDDGTCAKVYDRWRRSVDRFDPAVTVLALGRWELRDRVIGGRDYPLGARRTADVIERSLVDGLEILTSRGGRVALLTVPACFPARGAERRYSAEDAEWLNEIFESAAAKVGPEVQVVEYGDLLCPEGPDTEEGPVGTVADGVHVSEQGADVVWRWLATQPVFAR